MSLKLKFPTENEIEKAKELLEKFGDSTKGNDNLYTKILEKEEEYGSKIVLTKEELKSGKVGFSKTSIHNRIKGLNSIVEGDDFNTFQDKSSFKPENFSDFLSKCKKVYIIANEFIENKRKNNSSDYRTQQINNSIDFKPSSLSGSKWYVYFLYYLNESDKTGLVNEASVGKALLEFTENSDSKNLVKFTNIKSDITRHYSGYYQDHTDIHRGYIIIDIIPDQKKEHGRHIHMKLYCRDKDQDIMIGQNVSYERGEIQSGNIVLKKIDIDNFDENYEPKSYSFLHNWRDYKSNIPSAYRQFLSIRKINFNTANSNINTQSKLYDYIVSLRDSEKRRFSRFLERPKPRLFLSAPNTLKSKNIIKQMEILLLDEFDDKLHISYKIGKIRKTADLRGNIQPYMDIEKLKTTRFFVLILPEKINTLSYSFLQLGVALTVCKVVVVIGSPGSISDSLKEMPPEILKKIYVLYKIENEIRQISEKLVKVIKQSLPKHLGGEVPDLPEYD
ncbi:hypothetical protein KORDIASMS9_01845 [Kordia sp. SMS9]|uniref:hypothetical protein n=1 Tax=Kordia sp. SMS9 TaxID=2282170 RepID=UPI000E0D643B|nr:hypothetical protein [Kordia sp. SMS9]AXG69620.1 hypothetical protein KORDIASMS9_01845 [Kordia sp. SMS9]